MMADAGAEKFCEKKNETNYWPTGEFEVKWNRE
jgi:hypothetical protein